MWPLVRCTVRRTAPLLRIRIRVCRARRSRDWFFWLMGLLLLRLFENDDFVGVAHALALIGLRRTLVAHFGGHLADELLVDPGDHDLGLGRRRDLDALGHLVHDRVREA